MKHFLAIFCLLSIFSTANALEVKARAASGYGGIAYQSVKDCSFSVNPSPTNSDVTQVKLLSQSANGNDTTLEIPSEKIPLANGTVLQTSDGFEVAYQDGLLVAVKTAPFLITTLKLAMSPDLQLITQASVKKVKKGPGRRVGPRVRAIMKCQF